MNDLEFNLEDPQDIMWLGIHLNIGNSSQFNLEELKDYVSKVLKQAKPREELFLVSKLKEEDYKDKIALEDDSIAYVLQSTASGWKPIKAYKKIKRGKIYLYKPCKRY